MRFANGTMIIGSLQCHRQTAGCWSRLWKLLLGVDLFLLALLRQLFVLMAQQLLMLQHLLLFVH